MVKYTLFVIVLMLVTIINLPAITAQEITPETNNPEEFKGFYLGAIISTNGWGGEVKYVFNKRFTVRSGYESLNLS
jgi:hypothetical protein